jgi:alpha-maltose-1-phosphate synthase
VTKRVILGHPFGNANVRQALRAFNDEGMLQCFVTTLCAEHFRMLSLLPEAFRKEVQRRSFPGISSNQILSSALQESMRLMGSRLGRSLPLVKKFTPQVDDVWEALDRRLASYAGKANGPDLSVYAYEDGAFHTFSSPHDFQRIYELPIGYWRAMHQLLEEERDLQPGWAVTLKGLSDGSEKLRRKDLELRMAHKIIVPSDFVLSTLPPEFARKGAVVPYGCPEVSLEESERGSGGSSKEPLKVLFCGSLGQRKGMSYLFESVKRLGSRVELTVVGSPVAPCTALEGGLSKVKWISSLPHREMLALMRRHDVFLFPTLFEGRALVVLEALSQGLPVITTPNSGTTDVVLHRKTGYIVPIRSIEEIEAALVELATDRKLLQYMSHEALKSAQQASWLRYRLALLEAVKEPDATSVIEPIVM